VKRDKGNEKSVARIGIQIQQLLVLFQRAFDKSLDFCVNLTEELAGFLIQNKNEQ